MSRPMYENAQSLGVEEATMAAACMAWGAGKRKLPIAYRVDWAVTMNNAIVAWAECKRRYNPSTRYPTLILSLAKYMHGVELSERTGLPFMVVVEFDDGIWYYEHETMPPLVWGGRRDRNDSQDQEPLVDIPIAKFSRL
jgi:hypothetical protein